MSWRINCLSCNTVNTVSYRCLARRCWRDCSVYCGASIQQPRSRTRPPMGRLTAENGLSANRIPPRSSEEGGEKRAQPIRRAHQVATVARMLHRGLAGRCCETHLNLVIKGNYNCINAIFFLLHWFYEGRAHILILTFIHFYCRCLNHC